MTFDSTLKSWFISLFFFIVFFFNNFFIERLVQARLKNDEQKTPLSW